MRILNFRRNLLLSAAGLATIAVPMVFGQVNASHSHAESQKQNNSATTPKYEYEVASIKPNRSVDNRIRIGFRPDGFRATDVTLKVLIQVAFGLFEDNQISMGPGWLKTERYDVDAKVDSVVADNLQKLNTEQRNLVSQQMLQALLEDRFQFKYHRVIKELSVYTLVVAHAGKLHEDGGDCGSSTNFRATGADAGKESSPPCGKLFWSGGGHMSGQKIPITQLVDILSHFFAERVVLDKTGLTGKYDINLDWTPEPGQLGAPPEGAPNGLPAAPQPDTSVLSLFTALQEQLGLKLESGKGPIEVIVIDHVERPSEN